MAGNGLGLDFVSFACKKCDDTNCTECVNNHVKCT